MTNRITCLEVYALAVALLLGVAVWSVLAEDPKWYVFQYALGICATPCLVYALLLMAIYER